MTSPARVLERHPWLPYTAPFGVFLALTALQSASPVAVLWIYPVKTLAAAGLLWALRAHYPRFERGNLAWALGVGLVLFVIWVIPEGTYPLLGESRAFDPRAHLAGAGLWLWIGTRLAGAVVVVAFMEELFWRGFLLRWLVRSEFRQVPPGTFTWASFVITSVLFAAEHNRWLPGLVAGMGYNLLLYRTRSLLDCVVAHAVTNLVLGAYVLVSGRWEFW